MPVSATTISMPSSSRCRIQAQSAALLHGVDRVDAQVDQRLHQLVFIRLDGGRRFGERQVQRDMGTCCALVEHLGNMTNRPVDIDLAEAGRGETGVAHELFQHVADALNLAIDHADAVADIAARRALAATGIEGAAYQLQIHVKRIQRRAYLVIHTGSDLTQHGQLFKAQRGILRLLQLACAFLDLVFQFVTEVEQTFFMHLQALDHMIEGGKQLTDFSM
jgi:hypothetical protein